MKNSHFVIFGLALMVYGCNGQASSRKPIYNEDFKWSIIIPENFENVSAEQLARLEKKGADAIGKTYDAKIDNQTKTIFAFRSDKLNYFESNYQDFDPAIDGDYVESCKNVNIVLYETFKAQMPGIEIDTISTNKTIDDLDFRSFHMRVVYPNKMVLHFMMFSRLFDKKEFTVNIMYVDKEKGDQMLEAWSSSTFGK
jgi:hypothetical protein